MLFRSSGQYVIEAGLIAGDALASEQPPSVPRRANIPGLVVQPPAPTPMPASAAVAPAAPRPPAQATAIPGVVWQIANTGGDGVWLRRTPKLTDKLNAWPDGAIMKSLNEQANAEGLDWRKVQAPDGAVGWIPEKYLRALP